MPEFDPIFDASKETLPAGLRPTLPCPPLRLLLAHREGVLAEDAAAEIAGHLERCGLCRCLLADLEHGNLEPPGLSQRERDLMRRKLPIPMAADSKNWRWYAVSGALAAVLLMCAVLALRTWPSREGQTAQTAQVVQPKPPEPAVPSQEQQPQVEIAKLAPPLALAPGLVLRGGPVGQPNPDQLAPSFSAYEKSDYPLAAERFDLLAKQFPRAEVPVLYLGVTQLLMHDDQAAFTSLTRASQLATSETKDAAAWYLAIAAVRTRNPEAAGLLHDLCRRPKSAYAEQACILEAKH